MDTSTMARMKELEEVNRRLNCMYAEERMKAEIVPEALAKKVVRSSRRQDIAKKAVFERGMSIKWACQAFSISETCYRYEAKLNSENDEIAD
jgi:putative transposase